MDHSNHKYLLSMNLFRHFVYYALALISGGRARSGWPQFQAKIVANFRVYIAEKKETRYGVSSLSMMAFTASSRSSVSTMVRWWLSIVLSVAVRIPSALRRTRYRC